MEPHLCNSYKYIPFDIDNNIQMLALRAKYLIPNRIVY